MVSGVHFIELLIGQRSCWSRFNRYGLSSASTHFKSSLICTGVASSFWASDWSELLLVTLRPFMWKRSNTSTNIKSSLMYTVYTIYIHFWLEQPSSWLYRIHGQYIMYHHHYHPPNLLIVHTSNNLGLLEKTESRNDWQTLGITSGGQYWGYSLSV